MAEIKKTSDGNNFVVHTKVSLIEDGKDEILTPKFTGLMQSLIKAAPDFDSGKHWSSFLSTEKSPELFILTDKEQKPLRAISGHVSEASQTNRMPFLTLDKVIPLADVDLDKSPNLGDLSAKMSKLENLPTIVLPAEEFKLTGRVADLVQTVKGASQQGEGLSAASSNQSDISETKDGKYVVFQRSVDNSKTGYVVSMPGKGAVGDLTENDVKTVNESLKNHPELLDGLENKSLSSANVAVVKSKSGTLERLFITETVNSTSPGYIIMKSSHTLNLNKTTNPSQTPETLDNAIEARGRTEDKNTSLLFKKMTDALGDLMNSGKLAINEKPVDPMQKALKEFAQGAYKDSYSNAPYKPSNPSASLSKV